MSGMRSVTVFPNTAVNIPSSFQLDPNQQLQDLIDSSNGVKTAIENINQATPLDLTALLTRIETQTQLIDSFKQQADANQISIRVAVEAVKTAVDQLKATVEGEGQLLRDAIAQASEDEQANLTARLDASTGALQNTIIAESNETQAILTDTNSKLDSVINTLTGSPEALVTVSDNIDTSDGAKEIVLPAGWAEGDIGPNFLDALGAVVTQGAEFTVEAGGKTETVKMNGEWHRNPGIGMLGKRVPTLGLRIVIKQAPSTTHVVFSYPVSQAPAAIVATPVNEGTPTPPPAPPSGPSAEELVAGLAGNVTDDGGDPFTEDIVGVWDAINNGLTDFESAVTGEEIQVAQEQSDFTNNIRPLTEAEYNAFTALTRDQVGALMVANHSRFVRMVGNVYNLSDGAPYVDDHIGLKFAAVNGTFADVTTGANAARIDVDGDGTGDRAITQFEYNSFRALDIGYSQQIQASASGA